MDPNHLFSLPLQANPCKLDPCLNQNFITLPLTKSTIGVWKIHEIKQRSRDKSKLKPIELVGHRKQINALAFTNGPICQLASSCCEKILIWDFQNCDSSSSPNSAIESRLFFSNPGELFVMTFSNNNKTLACSKGASIALMESGRTEITSVFEMHNSTVTGLKFCPHYTSTLVSISEDRTCCVWDIKDEMLLFQSSILSSAPLLSLSMNLLSPCVTIGSGDGKLITFDLTSDHGFRQLMNIDIAGAIRKENEKTMKQCKESTYEEYETFAESSESILSIEYVYFSQSSESLETLLGQHISGAGNIVNDTPPILNVITTNHIIQVNSRSLELQSLIKLQSSIQSESFASSVTVGSVSYATAKQIGQFEMYIVVGTVFDRKIHIVDWCFMNEKLKSLALESNNNDISEFDTCPNNDFELSIVAVNDLEINSPLKSEMLPPIAKNSTTKGDIATGKKKPTSKLNQPLTFKSNVKSSGYSQAPRTTMFKPETSRQKLLNLSTSVKKAPSTKQMAGKMLKSDCDDKNWRVKDYIDTLEVDNRTTAVLNLRFTDDGTSLACALSNKTAMVVKSPFSKQLYTSLIGHNHSINSVYWSNCNSFVLTASNDKTIRLWDRSSGDQFMVMTHKKHNPKDGPPNESSVSKTSLHSIKQSTSQSSFIAASDNNPFSKEITRAQFYYMDKFILSTHGPDLSLFKYYVSREVDELKRYQSRNKYKLVENWTTSSSSFTNFSAVNNFFSHLVLCTTSGKSIEVYDINKSSLSHTFTDCHSRPPHHITSNEGSCFSSQSSQAYNVFATIAQTDPIKLWDLRSKSCVQALVGHHNKAHTCQISFSPCGNYLSSGSEDRALYVFDLRKGTFCDKLKGPSDVVCSVAYNPSKTLLVAGCLDSKVLWYK